MNWRTFEYLLGLEKEGSFRRAADACHISQPALSIQIKKFEDELGVQLLERGSKKFIFTPCGREVLKRARVIMQQGAEIKALADLWHDPYSGVLSIGAFPTLAPYYFPQITDHLVETYPHLQFNLVEEKTHILIDRLKSGALDAAFMALPVFDEAFEQSTIFSEEFFLGTPPDHPLAKQKIIDRKQLAGEKLLLLEEGHCLRGQALAYCATSGIGEALNFRATSMETLLQMIAMGRAISLIPECVARSRPHLSYGKLTGHGLSRTIALYWRKSSVRRDLMLELVDDLSRDSTP